MIWNFQISWKRFTGSTKVKMKLFFLLFFLISSALANPLQEAIDKAPPNSIIKLSEGTYYGNIIINKPLTIIGKTDRVIIQGEKTGTVVKVNSSYVTLKNLTISGSGNRMDRLDAGISINSTKNCLIQNCKILDSLYGIDMNIVSDSEILSNYITSKELDISLRGNALKMYYAHNNLIQNNLIENARDVTLNYSNHNVFKENKFFNNRFASHLSLSNDNTFAKNIYKYNSVSMMFMGAKDTNISQNLIQSSKGAAGIAVMIGGVSNLRFEKNTLKYNAKAIYIDGQEKAKGMKRYIIANEISHNGEALHFHASIKDNTITHNRIFGNIDDIVKDVEGNFGESNLVEYNYWDRYTGFDRNKDGIGDNPHQVYQYADQLWHYNNKIKFFYASPIMTLMNFLSNLAPFVEPNLIMEDTKPVFKD